MIFRPYSLSFRSSSLVLKSGTFLYTSGMRLFRSQRLTCIVLSALIALGSVVSLVHASQHVGHEHHDEPQKTFISAVDLGSLAYAKYVQNVDTDSQHFSEGLLCEFCLVSFGHDLSISYSKLGFDVSSFSSYLTARTESRACSLLIAFSSRAPPIFV